MGSMFKTPKVPDLPPPVPMAPLPDDPANLLVKKQQLAQASARSGAASLALSDKDYAARTTLGIA